MLKLGLGLSSRSSPSVPQPDITGWEQVGNTSSSIDTHAYMIGLNESDVAVFEFNNDQLSTYTFDGTDWALKGSSYDLTPRLGGAGADGGCKIADNKVCWLDHSGNQLGVYVWNGTDTWTEEHYADYTALFDQAGSPSGTLMAENKAIIQMGNASGDAEVRILQYNGSDEFTLLGNPLTTYASPFLTPIGLSSTRAAVHDNVAETLTTYDFDGSDWVQVGNALTVTAEVGGKQGCALSSNRVVIWDGSGFIQAYEFDGTDWATLGAAINTGATSWPNTIVALSPTRIAVKSYAGGWIKTYDAKIGVESSLNESPSAGQTTLTGSEDWNKKQQGFMWVRATPTDLSVATDQYIIDMNDGGSSPSLGIRIEPDDQMRNRYRDDSGDLSSDDLEENRSVEDTLRTYGVTWDNAKGLLRLISGGAYDEHTFVSGTFATEGFTRLNVGSRNGGNQPFTGTYEAYEIGDTFLSFANLSARMNHAGVKSFAVGGQSLMSQRFDVSADTGYISFVETADTYYGGEIVMINAAVTGSGLSNLSDATNYWWHRTNQVGGPSYTAWKTKVNNLSATPDWCFWAQGENDSSKIDLTDQITAAQYKADLLALFTQMRADINSNMQIAIHGIGRRISGYTNTGGIQKIREVQLELADENAWIHVVGYSYDLEIGDGVVHPTDAAYGTASERDMRRVALIDGETVTGSTIGPQATGAERSGTTVTVTISHDAGTDFTPTTGIVGFRFFDDGSEITVNSAVRTDANTVTLTLNSTPSGVEELYYCYDDATDITNANIANVLRDNSTEALPLVPFKITL